MSLLMDALRKAEEQKRKAEQHADAKTQSVPAKKSEAAPAAETPPHAELTLEAKTPSEPASSDSAGAGEVPSWLGRAKRRSRQTIPDVEVHLEESEPVEPPAPAEPAIPEAPEATPESYQLDDLTATDDDAQEWSVTPPPVESNKPTTARATAKPVQKAAPEQIRYETIEPPKPGQQTTAKQTVEPTPAPRPAEKFSERGRSASTKVSLAAERQSARSVFAAKINVARKKIRQRLIAAAAVVGVLAIAVTWYLISSNSGGGLQFSVEGYQSGQREFSSPPETQVEAIALTAPASGLVDDATGAASAAVEVAAQDSDVAPPAVPPTDTPFIPPPAQPTTQTTAQTVAQSTVQSTVPPAAQQSAVAAASTPVAAPSVSGTPAVAPESLPGAADPTATVPARATEPALRAPEESSVRVANVAFTRRESSQGIDPRISSAFAAYQAGRLDQARDLYQQVLATSPLHRDALLGLAAIAQANNEVLLARDLYDRLLTRDPGDAIARAGLLDLMPPGNPVAQERELRRLRELNPGEATMAFALGNFLAAQQRWPEAQQAYFDALQLARLANPDFINPDYAFNLAVSLDHLNQADAAMNFYRQARALAASHPAGFDAAALARRLDSAPGATQP